MGLVELMFNKEGELIKADTEEKVEAQPAGEPDIYSYVGIHMEPESDRGRKDFLKELTQKEIENIDAFCIGKIKFGEVWGGGKYRYKAPIQYYKLK